MIYSPSIMDTSRHNTSIWKIMDNDGQVRTSWVTNIFGLFLSSFAEESTEKRYEVELKKRGDAEAIGRTLRERHVVRYGVSWNGGTPIAGWFIVFIMENPTNMDDFGVDYFRKPPYVNVICKMVWDVANYVKLQEQMSTWFTGILRTSLSALFT